MGHKTKTEHAGAKNRGGSYGKREDVKRESRRLRRVGDREEISAQTPVAAGETESGTANEADSDERDPHE